MRSPLPVEAAGPVAAVFGAVALTLLFSPVPSRAQEVTTVGREIQRLFEEQRLGSGLACRQAQMSGTVGQRLKQHLYEVVIEGPLGPVHAILKTKKTTFESRGTFHICVLSDYALNKVALKDGFVAEWGVWTEDTRPASKEDQVFVKAQMEVFRRSLPGQ